MYKIEQLVQSMKTLGILKSPNIENAFLIINRRDFVPDNHKKAAFLDSPLPLVKGQTISQPSTVAFMLELLKPEKGDTVLDLGCGSGYTTALLSHLVGSGGVVWGVERIPEILDMAKQNLKKYKHLNYRLTKSKDDYFGLEGKKFDKILVSAAPNDIPPELLDQLKSPSRLVMPFGDSIYLFEKDKSGEILEPARYYGFTFVPLIKKGAH